MQLTVRLTTRASALPGVIIIVIIVLVAFRFAPAAALPLGLGGWLGTYLCTQAAAVLPAGFGRGAR